MVPNFFQYDFIARAVVVVVVFVLFYFILFISLFCVQSDYVKTT